MTRETPTTHPALAVVDNEIAALTESKREHQREAANLDNRAILLGALRAKIEKALMTSGIPRPSGEPPKVKRGRRTKAQKAADDAAAREKTIAAAAGLIKDALAVTPHSDGSFLVEHPAPDAYPDAIGVPDSLRRAK